MPKALKKTADRQRKEKFSNEELVILTTTLAANAEVVFVNDMRREALLKKKAIWAEVAQKVNAVGTTTRSVKDCRKRWDDLRVHVRNILSVNCNMAMGTGGGAESPLKLKEWEEICASTIGVESIEGVGDMELGMAILSDGGSHTETEEHTLQHLLPHPGKKPGGMPRGTPPHPLGDPGGVTMITGTKAAGAAVPRSQTPCLLPSWHPRECASQQVKAALRECTLLPPAQRVRQQPLPHFRMRRQHLALRI
ncbi:nuclear apoptosis-inducing factor 1-like [Ambystoma mexicanum]|uniref:nuclear apoptosis-inducing factor 1-like n=1 Tax=Ambystoma mexicanum TaxID=8296 RepID=UPI0037E8AF0A